MVATQEDLVISAIDDGLMECESEFAQALQDLDADLVRAFDTGAEERLQSIEQMNSSSQRCLRSPSNLPLKGKRCKAILSI